MRDLVEERLQAWREWYVHNTGRVQAYYAGRSEHIHQYEWYERALFLGQMCVGFLELCGLLISWQSQIRDRQQMESGVQKSEQVLRRLAQQFRQHQFALKSPETALRLLTDTQAGLLQVIDLMCQELQMLEASQQRSFEVEAKELERILLP